MFTGLINQLNNEPIAHTIAPMIPITTTAPSWTMIVDPMNPKKLFELKSSLPLLSTIV